MFSNTVLRNIHQMRIQSDLKHFWGENTHSLVHIQATIASWCTSIIFRRYGWKCAIKHHQPKYDLKQPGRREETNNSKIHVRFPVPTAPFNHIHSKTSIIYSEARTVFSVSLTTYVLLYTLLLTFSVTIQQISMLRWSWWCLWLLSPFSQATSTSSLLSCSDSSPYPWNACFRCRS